MYSLSKDYNKLFLLLITGKQVACFVDCGAYIRDICLCKRDSEWDICFVARGIQYGSVREWHKDQGTEFECFEMVCKNLNVEFITQ